MGVSFCLWYFSNNSDAIKAAWLASSKKRVSNFWYNFSVLSSAFRVAMSSYNVASLAFPTKDNSTTGARL